MQFVNTTRQGNLAPASSNSSLTSQTDEWARLEEACRRRDEKDVLDNLHVFKRTWKTKFDTKKRIGLISRIGSFPLREGASDDQNEFSLGTSPLEAVPSPTAPSHVAVHSGVEQQWRCDRAALLLGSLNDGQRLDMLHQAVENLRQTNEDETSSTIDLPEEDPNTYFAIYRLLEDRPELAFRSHAQKRPVFITAAMFGAYDLVRNMVETMEQQINFQLEGEELEQKDLEELVKDELFDSLKVSDSASNTALAVAVQNCHSKIVKVLLEKDLRLADDRFLKKSHIKTACSRGDVDIIREVLEARPSLKQSLPEIIVQAGSNGYKTWNAMNEAFTQDLPNSNILHLAVKNQQLQIVEWLVEKYPDLATHEVDDGAGRKIALAYNNEQKEHSRNAASIRDAIVPVIVRYNTPARIQRLLIGAGDTPHQFFLDLSMFNNWKTHNFQCFIDAVREDQRSYSGIVNDQRSVFDVKFEFLLRYVKFPDLSQNGEAQMSYPRVMRDDVPCVMTWLRRRRVKTVMKMIVPDSMINPHDEHTIMTSIAGLGIEELDWRRLDLGVEPIKDLASTLVSLHLYSSGNWAVISHWTSECGLKVFRKLQALRVVIVKDCIIDGQMENCLHRTKKEMNKLKISCGWSWDPVVEEAPFSEQRGTMRRLPNSDNRDNSEDLRSIPLTLELQSFAKKYIAIQETRFLRKPEVANQPPRKIKVALIDTGVVAMQDQTLSELKRGQIKPGISFVRDLGDEDRGSHWWLPSDEHGSQMAHLICSLDPYCELYPAQVAYGRELNTVYSVVEAIQWAIDQDVDIISMSLVLYKSHETLRKVINIAGSKDIVVICSTADKGNNHQIVYPARYQEEQQQDCVFPIAACDINGKVTSWSTETQAKFHFRGEDVPIRTSRLFDPKISKSVPRYPASPTRVVSGSSVATAIAAGTASLILACHLMAVKGEEPLGRRQCVQMGFQAMKVSPELRYVEPSVVFGDDMIKGHSLPKYVEETFKFDTNAGFSLPHV